VFVPTLSYQIGYSQSMVVLFTGLEKPSFTLVKIVHIIILYILIFVFSRGKRNVKDTELNGSKNSLGDYCLSDVTPCSLVESNLHTHRHGNLKSHNNFLILILSNRYRRGTLYFSSLGPGLYTRTKHLEL
jgi:hypothetical protein